MAMTGVIPTKKIQIKISEKNGQKTGKKEREREKFEDDFHIRWLRKNFIKWLVSKQI